jgi:hypothetical protein
VGNVIYRPGAAAGVISQTLPAGLQVPKGTRIDIEVQAPLSAPVITAPGNNTSLPPGRWPTIAWTQAEPYQHRWQVIVLAQQCTRTVAGGAETCPYVQVGPPVLATTKEYTGTMPQLSYATPVTGSRHTGSVVVRVEAIDDSGRALPGAEVKFFLEH